MLYRFCDLICQQLFEKVCKIIYFLCKENLIIRLAVCFHLRLLSRDNKTHLILID